jgi:tRNA(Ile)-lysidine synthase TilS/MesJ
MVRHILGISGGKDSAALAIYMKDKYPEGRLLQLRYRL